MGMGFRKNACLSLLLTFWGAKAAEPTTRVARTAVFMVEVQKNCWKKVRKRCNTIAVSN